MSYGYSNFFRNIYITYTLFYSPQDYNLNKKVQQNFALLHDVSYYLRENLTFCPFDKNILPNFYNILFCKKNLCPYQICTSTRHSIIIANIIAAVL